MGFDRESLYSYHCDCGANFPLADNRINGEAIICPACGRKYHVPVEVESWMREGE